MNKRQKNIELGSKKQKKILYYLPENDSYMLQWQRIHIFDELSHHDIRIEVFNPLHFASIDDANDNLIKLVRDNGPGYDLLLTCVGDKFLKAHIIREVKKSGLPALLICFDNLHAPFMHRKTASHFDLTWLTSHETRYMFERWGAKTVVQPYAANPYFFRPSGKPELPFAGFIGRPYGTRVHKINFLTSSGIPVALYTDGANMNKKPGQRKSSRITKLANLCRNLSYDIGRKMIMADFKKLFLSKSNDNSLVKNEYLSLHPSVSFEKMSELFSSFALSIGITEITNTYLLAKPVYKLHLRTFEIPMSGGLQITNYTDELASYFNDGEEIVLYKSKDELVSKAKFYLDDKNKKLRMKIKMAARKRAEAEHTWFKRFEKVFSILGI